MEAGGSNLGDGAIFHSQVRSLSGMNTRVGVMSADPARTGENYPGVKSFFTGRGRLHAMLSGVRWADVVVVGGGELLQDRSSLLYSPFNLMPLVLARLFRRRSFCWAVGIGRKGELARTTPPLARFALASCDGITARDRPTYTTLIEWGFTSPVLKPAADSALLLGREFEAGPVDSSVLGAAPRNVLNRKGALLPLELRRRFPGYHPDDPSPAAAAWAAMIDRHLDRNEGRALLFPFHTGTLSNDDLSFCRLVLGAMKHADRASIAVFDTVEHALSLIAGCRVMVTTPLHGAILSVVAGALPVAVPYSSKCSRFMEMAGLEALAEPGNGGVPGPAADRALDDAWRNCGSWWEKLGIVREELKAASEATPEHFRSRVITC
ncbi:MAG: polysaccharide pyruvyl transferase family protein [Candidatus Fermentibacteraceae bacterium]